MTQDATHAQDPLTRFIGRQPALSPAQGNAWDESRRYRLVSVLGEGGFGKVYQAEDTFSGNALVAVKSINLSGLSATQVIEATAGFNREVQLLSTLSHPHLPRIHDHFTDPEHWYLVLDFIPGESLEHFMQVHQSYRHPPDGTGFTPGGPLTLAEIFDLALQLCDVLDYLHAHKPPIIFRDLKPSNIMRTPPGQHFLIDFGIARHFKPGQQKDTIPFGSPGYAAPEQYGRAQTTPRTDIYSLGALLHHLLTGHDPAENGFAFAPLPELPPALQGFEVFLRKMLAIHPEERPSSMKEVRDALEYCMSQLGLLPSG
ncbi:MAG TPA: serine/threonine-protein kinase, partial [Ktedonobacteraceae bacterium]|nr:serine/threonine-protein kinase [Ktedonobacteraceae bacterium]